MQDRIMEGEYARQGNGGGVCKAGQWRVSMQDRIMEGEYARQDNGGGVWKAGQWRGCMQDRVMERVYGRQGNGGINNYSTILHLPSAPIHCQAEASSARERHMFCNNPPKVML